MKRIMFWLVGGIVVIFALLVFLLWISDVTAPKNDLWWDADW